MDLLRELSQLNKALKDNDVEFALCGGLAMAVYSFPRATLDIDLMLDEKDLQKVREIAKKLGFDIDAGLRKFQRGKVHIYRLTKMVPGSKEVLSLDLLLLTPAVKEAWEGRKNLRWAFGEIPVVSPEGLIHLKSIRGSGQDNDDIQNLKRLLNED